MAQRLQVGLVQDRLRVHLTIRVFCAPHCCLVVAPLACHLLTRALLTLNSGEVSPLPQGLVDQIGQTVLVQVPSCRHSQLRTDQGTDF